MARPPFLPGKLEIMDHLPVISIGMPVYNGRRTIRHAVNSILAQTFTRWELLIIDDGSNDDTLFIVTQFSDLRIRVFSDGQNLGLGARLNQAVGLARGKYFARMDADDFSLPQRLLRQVDFLENNPRVDLVGTSVIVVQNEKKSIGVRIMPQTHDRICSDPDQGFKLMHPTWMGSTAWFRAHPYNEKAILCEDQDLLLRTYENSCYANIKEPLLEYREERLSLKKLLLTRWFWTRQLIAFWLGTKKNSAVAWNVALKQSLKAAVDAAAILFGLDYSLLRHRAAPAGLKYESGVAGDGQDCKKMCLVTSVPVTVRAFLVPHIKRLSNEFDITLVTNGSKGEFSDLKLPEGIKFKKIAFVRNPHPVYDILCFIQLYRFLRKNHFYCVHSFIPKTGLLAMTAARLAKVPVRVHTFTGQVWATRKGFGRWLLKEIDRFFASQASFILADSESQRRFLLREKVIAPGKSGVLLNGSISGVNIKRFSFDPAVRKRVRKKLAVDDTDVVFLFVGRLKQDKGVLELGRAFARLRQNANNSHLLIVGSDEESIQHTAVFKTMEQVYFMGHTGEPEKFMNAADILCLPSHREGFGSVIIEAACVGIPCVASRIYGICDAVVEGSTGFLHRPGDIDDLERCMTILLENPDLRKNMGMAARRRVMSDFSEERVTAALADFYKNYNSATSCGKKR
jgi:glycosyltransferase involved in cell wall biosynthesis